MSSHYCIYSARQPRVLAQNLRIQLPADVAGCAMAGVCDVTSQNCVGYADKDARSGFNYYAPTFREIGSEAATIPLNMIQVKAATAVGTRGASLQILTSTGGTVKDDAGKNIVYYWVKQGDSKYQGDWSKWTGKAGIWCTCTGSNVATYKYFDPDTTKTGQRDTLAIGECVTISGKDGQTVGAAGQVGEETVAFLTRDARSGFNYVGNPFPAAMSLNNIQVDANTAVGTRGASLQILTSTGGTVKDASNKNVVYYWVKRGDSKYQGDWSNWPEEKYKGIWCTCTGSNVATYKYFDPDPAKTGQQSTLAAGDGVTISGKDGQVIWMICPYEL